MEGPCNWGFRASAPPAWGHFRGDGGTFGRYHRVAGSRQWGFLRRLRVSPVLGPSRVLRFRAQGSRAGQAQERAHAVAVVVGEAVLVGLHETAGFVIPGSEPLPSTIGQP